MPSKEINDILIYKKLKKMNIKIKLKGEDHFQAHKNLLIRKLTALL